MIEVFKSVERSYNLASTLILLATVWMGLALLSYKNKRTLNLYIEATLMTICYLASFVLFINSILYEPVMVILKLIGHTLIIGMGIVIMFYKKKPKKTEQ